MSRRTIQQQLVIVGSALALTGCMSMSPGPVTASTPAREPGIGKADTSFTPAMHCLGSLIEVYRHEMEPITIYVPRWPNLSGTGREQTSEIPSQIEAHIKSAILELDPKRVRLLEPTYERIVDTGYTFALVGEVNIFDRGIQTYKETVEGSLDVKQTNAQASFIKDVGFARLGTSSRTLMPDKLSSTLPLHVGMQAAVGYNVEERRYSIGLFGATGGSAKSHASLDGRGAVLQRMGQETVFAVLSRYLGVPGHRCLEPGAKPDAEWLKVFSERVGRKSDVELTMNLQESLVESGKLVQVTGKLDPQTLQALGSQASAPLIAAGNDGVRRKALEDAFFNVYVAQPVDLAMIKAARVHLEKPGTYAQGWLRLEMRTPMVVMLDNKVLELKRCKPVRIPLRVGDHHLVLGTDIVNKTTGARSMQVVDNLLITAMGNREERKVIAAGDGDPGACGKTPAPLTTVDATPR